ncbi:MAG: family 16 glycosylhydrolase [Bacteroidota bacterium]|nr:family 16 glycosylhydrolase [Bacteroidota bacterium]
MRHYILLLFLGIALRGTSQPPYKLSRADDNGGGKNTWAKTDCESRVKVVDERPSDCGIGSQYSVLYPVIVEDFNYKNELPNNWSFNLGGGDDNYDSKPGAGFIWVGSTEEAFANNVEVSGGKIHLKFKKEPKTQMPSPIGPRDYYFTGAFLKNLSGLKPGVFISDIKLPDCPYFWPAYWLRGDVGNKQEIDIFEFWDGNTNDNGICDEKYHQMRTTIHGMPDNDCRRNRRRLMAPDFFDNMHKYQCTWTDFRIDFILDQQLSSYANKYYQGYYSAPTCPNQAESGIPDLSHGCTTMQNLQGCNITNPFNSSDCWESNKVDKDEGWPLSSVPMSFRITNSIIHSGNAEALNNEWSNFSDGNGEITIDIDRVEIWQPINCSVNRNVLTINDFLSQTGNTNFLSGNDLNLGYTASSSEFISEAKSNANNWTDRPIHLLATNEIKLTGASNVIFEEGSHLRAVIIDCNGMAYSQKSSEQNPSYVSISDEEITNLELKELSEKFAKDSLTAMSYWNQMKETYGVNKKSTSKTDNGAINIYPNPTNDYLNLDLDDADFYDLQRIEIINTLGQTVNIDKSTNIDVRGFSKGYYTIKFYFSFGYIVVKSFVKT